MKPVLSATSSKAPRRRRPARQSSRLHRWLGTGFCLLFTLWFGTGFIMMYVPFPSLGEGERIAASGPVAPAAVNVAPATAVQGLPGLSVLRLRLVDVLGRPRYLATLDNGRVLGVDADDGGTSKPLDAAQAELLAGRFARQPVQSVSGPFDYDQWVVHHRFDAARPFYKIALGDAAGTELYVSAGLGQVLQRTTRFERGWNWAGAVVHWMYPTVLRKNSWAWERCGRWARRARSSSWPSAGGPLSCSAARPTPPTA